MWFKTDEVILTSGKAIGGYELSAFDGALRSAGIADFNLIKVTSIVPESIPVKVLKSGALAKGKGRMMPTVYECLTSDEPGTRIAAGVGIGIVKGDSGVIFTHSCYGSSRDVRNIVRNMIDETMRSRKVVRYHCRFAIASARVLEPWTCVLAAAAFCDQDLLELIRE